MAASPSRAGSRSPLVRGRPRLPVRAGGRPNKGGVLAQPGSPRREAWPITIRLAGRARPHVAAWAETEIVLAADLGDSIDDPHATGRTCRAALWAPCHSGHGTRAGSRCAPKPGTSPAYWPGPPAHEARIGFAIGAKRIAPLWRLLAGIAADDWHDTTEMGNAQVAQYCPNWVTAEHPAADRPGAAGPGPGLRRPKVTAAPHPAPGPACPADPRTGRCRAIYAYSFILTNLDVSAPDKAAAVEHWHRHRTTVENIFRDSKLGAAL